MPYPWPDKGRYEQISYDLDHLAPFERNIKDTSGVKRRILFSFSYHCFTDGEKPNDFRTRYVDPGITESKPRVFCPKRWLLSRDLVKELTGDLSKLYVIPAGQSSYGWNKTLDSMDKPYFVAFSFGISKPDHPLPIEIKTAYVRGGGRYPGKAERFAEFIKTTCGANGSLALSRAAAE